MKQGGIRTKLSAHNAWDSEAVELYLTNLLFMIIVNIIGPMVITQHDNYVIKSVTKHTDVTQ